MDRRGFDRRTFVRATSVGAVAAYAATALSPVAWAEPARSRAASVTGTTLDVVGVPATTGRKRYRKLVPGAGWPLVVRSELAAPKSGRDDRRVGLASVVQTTDVHIVDAESPVRAEFVHLQNGSAFRPHEKLGTHGAITLVERINALGAAPFSGRPFDAVVSTGDNTDNHEMVELEWFLTVFSGGRFQPSTGDLNRYEGVQSWGSTFYWQPETSVNDIYKQRGFPQVPGLLASSITPIESPGLNTKWYSVFGNHDDSVEGTLPSGIAFIDNLYTGDIKIDLPQDKRQIDAMARVFGSDPYSAGKVFAEQVATGPIRKVTPDARRKPFTPRQYMAEHFRSQYTGPGPVGHGFAPDAPQSGVTYYSFEIAPGVIGISMDTTNHAGFTDGSIGQAQLDWMERLISRNRDSVFVAFSHHTSDTMELPIPDPEHPAEPRRTGPQLLDFFHRHPNVLAWVNGHTHVNKITPHAGPTPAQSFWEINTASHIDFPQNARIVEVCDNKDGTLSLFCTLIESAAPYSVDYADHSITGLASMYREFSYNDIGYEAKRLGGAADHNVELLLVDPR